MLRHVEPAVRSVNMQIEYCQYPLEESARDNGVNHRVEYSAPRKERNFRGLGGSLDKSSGGACLESGRCKANDT